MNRARILVWMVGGLMVLAAGCTSYYVVTDPATGKTYYTTKVNDAGRSGAVKFEDKKAGGTVTLQSSIVKEISSDEFEAGISKTVDTQKAVWTQKAAEPQKAVETQSQPSTAQSQPSPSEPSK